jgi:hypothetical protein
MRVPKSVYATFTHSVTVKRLVDVLQLPLKHISPKLDTRHTTAWMTASWTRQSRNPWLVTGERRGSQPDTKTESTVDDMEFDLVVVLPKHISLAKVNSQSTTSISSASH